MKNFLTTIGPGRLAGVASMVALLVGAMVATPMVAAANEGSDGLILAGDTLEDQSATKVFEDTDQDDGDTPPNGDEQDGPVDGEDDGRDEDGSPETPENGESADPSVDEGATSPETGDDTGEPTDEPDGSTNEPAEIDVDGIMSFDAESQTLSEYLDLFGLNEDQIVDAVMDEIEDQVNSAVAEGDLTQEQADEILSTATADVSALIGDDVEGDAGEADGGDDDGAVDGSEGDDTDGDVDESDDTGTSVENGDGNVEEEPEDDSVDGTDGQDGTDDGVDNGFDEQFELPLDVVAELTGTDVAAVTAALESGQTLAQFAEEHGVLVDDLVAALIADVEATTAEAVASGALTQEQADEMLAGLEDWVTSMVNDGAIDDGVGDMTDDQPPAVDDNREVPPDEGTGETPDTPDAPDEGAQDDEAQIEDLTGTTAEELLALLSGGMTLAETAAEQGISVDELVISLVGEVEALVAQAVESGELTEEQADGILGAVDGLVTSILDVAGIGGIVDGTTPDEGGTPDECIPVPPNGAPADDMVMPEQACPMGS